MLRLPAPRVHTVPVSHGPPRRYHMVPRALLRPLWPPPTERDPPRPSRDTDKDPIQQLEQTIERIARAAEQAKQDLVQAQSGNEQSLSLLQSHLQQAQDDRDSLAKEEARLQSEVSNLEERLAHANHELSARPLPPHEDDVAQARQFEVGFGIQEQTTLLNTLAAAAEDLTYCLMDDQRMQQHVYHILGSWARDSDALYFKHLERIEDERSDTLMCAAGLQQAVMTAALDAARVPQLNAFTQAQTAISGFETAFAGSADTSGLQQTLLHLDAQLSRVFYLAGCSASTSRQYHAHHQVVTDWVLPGLTARLGVPDTLAAVYHAHLEGLSNTAYQVILLCRSLQHQAPGCSVVCGGHVGQEWSEGTMEPPVKEIPVGGLSRCIVLACTRPSLQYPDPSDGHSVALVKPQVVVLQPACDGVSAADPRCMS